MGTVCTIRRPGREPPAPPPPSPGLTGNVCLEPEERAALSRIATLAQQLARFNAGYSVPAAALAGIPGQMLGLAQLNALMAEAAAQLAAAHETANQRRGR